MANLLAPSAIIYINNDLSQNVISILQTQLYIDSGNIMSGAAFDAILSSNPNYPNQIHGSGQRILVLRNLLIDFTNRNVADIVLKFRNGLLIVETNKVGPPGITFSIDRVLLGQLFFAINQTQSFADEDEENDHDNDNDDNNDDDDDNIL